MRRSAALLALSAALVAGACSRRERPFDGALLRFTERLDDAELELRAPLPLEGVVLEVVWVRDGLASIVVRLRAEDGVGGEAGGRVLKRWGLPIPPAPPEAGGPDGPELVGLPLEHVSFGESKERANGFWLSADELGIVHSAAFPLPESLTLRYTVHAAHVAGTAVGAGFSRQDSFAVRSRRGSSSKAALALPANSTLRTTLPPVGAGRLAGSFRALHVQGDDASLQVTVKVDEDVVFDAALPTADPVPLGTEQRPWVDLAASDASRTLEVSVEGPPGGLALFEEPRWSRPRSWRDGPNVLLVVVDGLRPDTLGSHGGVHDVTEALDDLAEQSVRFADAWSTSSWGLPSMATLLTSTYGSEHLAARHDRRLGRGVTTLAEVFRDAGYRTVAFADGGFVSPAYGLDRGFDSFDAQGGGAAAVVARMREHLKSEPDGPWFALVHASDPLPPYEPPAERREEVDLRHPDEAKHRPPDPARYLDFARAKVPIRAEVARYLRDLYQEEVRGVDEALALLFGDLRERDLFSNALVAVTATHGQEFGERGFLGFGDTLFPEVLRVPLLVKLPRNERAGLVELDPVSLIDLAPTLLDGAGLPSPSAGTTFRGVSLLAGRAPTNVFGEREHPVAGTVHALRAGRRMIFLGRAAFHSGPAAQLYDVVSDPGATHDLARTQPALVKSLSQQIKLLVDSRPPRVEGAESALSKAQLDELDPLPGAEPQPAAPPAAAEGAGRPRRRG